MVEEGGGPDAVFLPDDRGNHVPIGGKVTEDLQGLLLVCCDVVPLRDLDLVTTFKAASFCVAFFSLLYCIWKS